MPTVEDLLVRIDASTETLRREMKRADKAVAGSSRKIDRSLRRIDKRFDLLASSAKRAFAAVGGSAVLGLAGIALAVRSALRGAKEAIDFVEQIGKAADAIGITTGALQEYRFALDIAGVATEKTDKGLTKFVRNMGELERSSSETQTALKDLDPALLQNLRSLDSVEDQLTLAFRALASYTSQSKRAAVAQALFGRSGVAMTVAVKNGIAAFEALLKSARDLGIVLEDSVIRKAEQTKDELTILEKQIKTDTVEALLELQGVVVLLDRIWAAWLQQLADTPRALDQIRGLTGLSPLEKEAAQAADAVGKLNKQINQLQAEMNEAATDPDMGLARLVLLEDKMVVLVDKHTLALDKLAQAHRRVKAATERRAAKTALTEALDAPGAPAPRRTRAPSLGALQAFMLALEQETALLRLSADVREQEVAVRRAQAIAMREGNLLTEREIKNIRNEVAERQGLARGIQATEKAERDANAAREEAKDRLGEVTSEIALQRHGLDLVDDAIRGNITSWEDLGQTAVRALQSIISEIIRGNALANSSGGLFGSLLGGLFNFGATGTSLVPSGLRATPPIPIRAPGRAQGGPVAAGGIYQVGERGRELFRPDTAGTIIPNSALGGGGGIHLSQSFAIDARGAQPGVGAEIDRALARAAPVIVKASIDAVIAARRRQPRLFN